MKTKYLFTLLAFLFITNSFAQSTNLNDYKYVIVPRKFNFLKEVDKYQLNSLTKFLFEKENFKVLFNDDKIPDDLFQNRCLALYADVMNDSGMFKTKLKVELKDCSNQVLFLTKEGVSKDKNFKKAYHEALRDAFQSFNVVNYSYQPKKNTQEIKEIKPKPVTIAEKPIAKKETVEHLVEKEKEQAPVVKKPEVKQTTTSTILYAQAINEGFQLVDSSPKVVMVLLSTPKKNLFMVKGQDAIVYEEGGIWYLAKNADSKDTLNIKF